MKTELKLIEKQKELITLLKRYFPYYMSYADEHRELEKDITSLEAELKQEEAQILLWKSLPAGKYKNPDGWHLPDNNDLARVNGFLNQKKSIEDRSDQIQINDGMDDDEQEKSEKSADTNMFEFHNYKTGHCYLDYIPHKNQDEKDGYTKIPLYYAQQFKREIDVPSDREVAKWAKEYDKSAHCGQFDGDNPSRHAYNAIMWFKSEILRRNK